MSIDFWHELWNTDNTPFHLSEVNQQLTKFYDDIIHDSSIQSVLLPLCGKSIDILFFHNLGYEVVGIELSEKAIRSFFKEQQLSYEINEVGDFKCFQHGSLKLYCGDYFEVNSVLKQSFDLIYDRAALIALPKKLRSQYVAILKGFAHEHSRLFVIALDYPQDLFEGPPYSVTDQEIKLHFSDQYMINCLNAENSINVPDPIKGNTVQRCYLLERLNE